MQLGGRCHVKVQRASTLLAGALSNADVKQNELCQCPCCTCSMLPVWTPPPQAAAPSFRCMRSSCIARQCCRRCRSVRCQNAHLISLSAELRSEAPCLLTRAVHVADHSQCASPSHSRSMAISANSQPPDDKPHESLRSYSAHLARPSEICICFDSMWGLDAGCGGLQGSFLLRMIQARSAHVQC